MPPRIWSRKKSSDWPFMNFLTMSQTIDRSLPTQCIQKLLICSVKTCFGRYHHPWIPKGKLSIPKKTSRFWRLPGLTSKWYTSFSFVSLRARISTRISLKVTLIINSSCKYVKYLSTLIVADGPSSWSCLIQRIPVNGTFSKPPFIEFTASSWIYDPT